jgi:membrane protease YdiL (CAAX protease family)
MQRWIAPQRAEKRSIATASVAQPIQPFFWWVLLFSLPFWAIGWFADAEILPGLPVSALMVVAPVAAAVVLIHRESSSAGVTALLRRSFDHRRIASRVWLAPTILVLPLSMLTTYGVIRVLGRPLPDPDIRWLSAPLLLAVFFISALTEELGWSGFILEPMQQRWGALQASVLLGMAWAIWHFIPLHQVGRSPGWIAWWTLYAVASRVLYTWIYNNTGGSVFAVTLVHAMANLSWQLFPNNGSHFDPQIAGFVVTAVALLVTAVWRGRTLSRHETPLTT